MLSFFKFEEYNMQDKEVFSCIGEEEYRIKMGANFIASENYVSQQVEMALASRFTSKYAEGYPGKRYYGGCEFADKIEILAIERAKTIFGAKWVNVQPHSGSQANAAVMLALLNPGDKILGFDLAHGGHLTHGSPHSFSGKLYKTSFYGVDKTTEQLNYDEIESIARREKPKLIICGASSYSRDWDYEKFRLIADSVGAYLLGDISHTAGLIAAKLLNDPVPHCHIITSTTHKTMRGPRGAIIFGGEDFELKNNNNEKKTMLISKAIDSAVFPGIQGGPHMNTIAAKAVSFGEILNPSFERYAKTVIRNSKFLAERFSSKYGYRIVSGGTDNHLFLLDLSDRNITGKRAEEILGNIMVSVNKNLIPFDTKSPMVTSGIRIGSPAMTTRFADQLYLGHIVDLMHRAMTSSGSEEDLIGYKAGVEGSTYDLDIFSGMWN